MGQNVCVEARNNNQDTSEKLFSQGNSYRSEYFANLKNCSEFRSIDIHRVRFAKIEIISMMSNGNLSLDGNSFVFVHI